MVPSSPGSSLSLGTSVRSLRGVGPARARRLEALGVRTVGDLLHHLPFRYERWEPPRSISTVRPGEEVTVRGRVASVRLHRLGRRRSLLRVGVRDAGGSLEALFFNQPYLRDRFRVGEEVVLHGKTLPRPPVRLSAPRVEGPSSPFPSPGTLLPVYPSVQGLGQTVLRGLAAQALSCAGAAAEDLDAGVRDGLGLPTLEQALCSLHAPSRIEEVEPARRRLAFRELLDLQRRLARARRRRLARRAPGIDVDDVLDARIRARFPFAFTPGQESAVADLRRDLAAGVPMRRILQGEVGCGKTAVALYGALAAVARGWQAAVLAPTTLLAAQHAASIRRFLAGTRVRVVLAEGSASREDARAARDAAREGRAQLVVGTHALLADRFSFRRLGLAVLDEQHRFGVAERARLLAKGRNAHALALTATPIPRTLAMTLYGDLDLSTIEDRPPGRGRTRTRLLPATARPAVVAEVAGKVRGGARAYWIVPRIEASDTGRGAVAAFREFRRGPFRDRPIGLVHGGIRPGARAETLEGFRRGSIALLVATTVVEVGLDVPEATILVVDGAERLGLAALHQLRGRVGRGAEDAECVLLAEAVAHPRLAVLEATEDGFRIAEEDLRRRGPGEAFGARQWGAPLLRAADLVRDGDLIRIARDLALSSDEGRAILRPSGPARGSALFPRLAPAPSPAPDSSRCPHPS